LSCFLLCSLFSFSRLLPTIPLLFYVLFMLVGKATATLAHQLDSLLIGSLKNQLATDSYKLRANLQCFDRQPHEQKKANLRPLQASRCSPVPIRNRDSRSYATILKPSSPCSSLGTGWDDTASSLQLFRNGGPHKLPVVT
jgi:hypothetical protein